MKGPWFQRFTREYLLPHLEGFTAKGKFVFRSPVGPIFQGFLFDSSGFSKEGFYPQVFVQPLYVRESVVVLTLGERFSGNWTITRGNEKPLGDNLLASVRSVGLPFLAAMGSPEKLAHPPSRWADSPNVHVQRSIAYSLAMIGENTEALKKIEALCERLHGTSERRDWEDELLAELTGFHDLLSRDSSEAQRRLSVWTEETRKNLKLPD
jgi:hypothetical protein